MYDFLVIGHGLAGSLLSIQLRKQGASVIVIDQPELSSCSRVAAGIINPLALRRMSMSWRADEFCDYLERFYPLLETESGRKFYHPAKMLKPYGSVEDKLQWQIRKSDALLRNFIASEDVFCDPPVINPFACMEILHSGCLDTVSFLQSASERLGDNYRQERFTHAELRLQASFVRYKNIEAKRIIFCEGFRAMMDNPWFRNIPFALTKGQVLDVKIDDLQSREILNRGVFILPLKDKNFRLGATYSWRDYTETPTETATAELLTKAAGYIDSKITVLEARAGIRPTIRDRRPVMGIHPEYPQLAIFNGMGSKAVMFAPLLAKQFSSHLLHGSDIFPETSLSRFSS